VKAINEQDAIRQVEKRFGKASSWSKKINIMPIYAKIRLKIWRVG